MHISVADRFGYRAELQGLSVNKSGQRPNLAGSDPQTTSRTSRSPRAQHRERFHRVNRTPRSALHPLRGSSIDRRFARAVTTYCWLFGGFRACGPDLLPGNPGILLVSRLTPPDCPLEFGPFTAGPDLLPGMPGTPAPLFGVPAICAIAADPPNRLAATISKITVRMAFLLTN